MKRVASAVATTIGLALFTIAIAPAAQAVTNPAANPHKITVTGDDGNTYVDGQDTLPGYDDEACTYIPGAYFDFDNNRVRYPDGQSIPWTEWERATGYADWVAKKNAAAQPATTTGTAPAAAAAPAAAKPAAKPAANSSTTAAQGTAETGDATTDPTATVGASAPSLNPSASPSASAGPSVDPSATPSPGADAVLAAGANEGGSGGSGSSAGLAILAGLFGVAGLAFAGYTFFTKGSSGRAS